MNTSTKHSETNLVVRSFTGKLILFKDEGDYFTTKLTIDDNIPDSDKMYPFGELKTEGPFTVREAKAFAKARGMVAHFY